LGWRRLVAPVHWRRAVRHSNICYMKRLLHICTYYRSFYYRLAIVRSRRLKQIFFKLWQQSLHPGLPDVLEWKASHSPGLLGDSQRRAVLALSLSRAVADGSLTSVSGCFRRWVAYSQSRIVARHICELFKRRRMLCSVRNVFWALYHQVDPSSMTGMLGASAELRCVNADIQLWKMTYYYRIRKSHAMQKKREYKIQKQTLRRLLRGRPRLRDFIQQQRERLENRIRNEQRLLVIKFTGTTDAHPTRLRARRLEINQIFERTRRFVLRVRHGPIKALKSIHICASLFMWVFQALTRGLVSEQDPTLPSHAAFIKHINLLTQAPSIS